MKNIVVRNILRFILLMVIQLLVLNHVSLGGYITPFLFVAFVLMLPTYMDRRLMLLAAFLTGFCVDMFSNVLGFHACCCTLVAMLRILFADKILTRNDPVEFESPSIRTAPWQQYSFYSLLLLLVYFFIYFLLVLFSFKDIWRILVSAVFSTLVTWVLLLLYQLIFIKKDKSS